MTRRIATIAPMLVLAPGVAMAAGDYPFFSLANTDLIVLIAFVLFLGVLAYFNVHNILLGLLDKRADDIRADLDAARALREEAQAVLADYERKTRDAQQQAENIVIKAREEAKDAAAQAKRDIEASVARRLKAAEDQIASAEQAALRSVRNRAARIAVAAAADVIAKQMSEADAGRLIDEGIATVEARLH